MCELRNVPQMIIILVKEENSSGHLDVCIENILCPQLYTVHKEGELRGV